MKCSVLMCDLRSRPSCLTECCTTRRRRSHEDYRHPSQWIWQKARLYLAFKCCPSGPARMRPNAVIFGFDLLLSAKAQWSGSPCPHLTGVTIKIKHKRWFKIWNTTTGGRRPASSVCVAEARLVLQVMYSGSTFELMQYGTQRLG